VLAMEFRWLEDMTPGMLAARITLAKVERQEADGRLGLIGLPSDGHQCGVMRP